MEPAPQKVFRNLGHPKRLAIVALVIPVLLALNIILVHGIKYAGWISFGIAVLLLWVMAWGTHRQMRSRGPRLVLGAVGIELVHHQRLVAQLTACLTDQTVAKYRFAAIDSGIHSLDWTSTYRWPLFIEWERIVQIHDGIHEASVTERKTVPKVILLELKESEGKEEPFAIQISGLEAPPAEVREAIYQAWMNGASRQ